MMQLLMVIFVALVGSAVKADEESISDLSKPTPQLIEEANYTGEIHHVTTEDGYILEMHRISGSPLSPAAKGKPVVFLMHGLTLSSADWIVTGPKNGFGYLLADAGYDVWMGNARGNTYSKNHTNITGLSESAFWHFSWHEIGYYDLPAMIDYSLEYTNQTDLIFVGHSQGNTVFYVMASLRSDYNDKIKAMFSLAPVAYMTNAKSPLLRFAAKFSDFLTLFTKLFGANEFLPSSELLTSIAANLCSDEDITQEICSSLLYLLLGYDPAQLNETALPTFLGHTPAGVSTLQIIHYCQEVQSGKFAWYNEGGIKNLLVYGSATPPSYDLSKITAPVYLWYGDNDALADPKDVELQYSELGNPVELNLVSYKGWNHIDFVWGNNAKEFIYDPIMKTIEAILQA